MRSFLAIGLGFVAGSAMTVLVGTARAEPMPGSAAAEALARAQMAEIHADAARARAAELAKAGGWPYKTGLIRASDREAAAYQAEAKAARSEVTGANLAPLAVSPAMLDAQQRVADLKFAGGWAWKTGAVDRAKEDVQALKRPSPYLSSQNETVTPTPKSQNKPDEQIELEQTGHAYR